MSSRIRQTSDAGGRIKSLSAIHTHLHIVLHRTLNRRDSTLHSHGDMFSTLHLSGRTVCPNRHFTLRITHGHSVFQWLNGWNGYHRPMFDNGERNVRVFLFYHFFVFAPTSICTLLTVSVPTIHSSTRILRVVASLRYESSFYVTSGHCPTPPLLSLRYATEGSRALRGGQCKIVVESSYCVCIASY